MPISDNKKAYALINAMAQEAARIKLAATRLKAIRTLYQDQSVDPTGTPLDGNVTAVSGWIDDVDDVATATVANAMIAAEVPSHGTHALEV